MFAFGDDQTTGSATSLKFTIGQSFAKLRWQRSGGADVPSGLYLKLTETNKPVPECEPDGTHGKDTNAMQYHDCDVSKYVGKSVYFEISDRIAAGWGKVAVDDITFFDADGAPLIAELFCEITSTSTTTTTTTNTIIPALQKQLSALTANVSSFADVEADIVVVQDTMVVLKTAIEKQTDAMAEAQRTIKIQAGTIGRLEAQLTKLQGQMDRLMAPPSPAPPVSPVPPADPAIEADGRQSLALLAPGGAVTFRSAECESTDLCELKRGLQSVLDKFDF